MPTTILTIRYRSTPSKCAEVRGLFGWLNGNRLILEEGSGQDLLLNILYCRLNSTKDFKNSSCMVIGFDEKEHEVERISIGYQDYDPHPKQFVEQMTSSKIKCEIKDG